MTLPLPTLDDRRWDELVADARARIPSLNADWTDFNPHDPGITFLELFAWLAEIQRYRVDRASDATKLRFLELIDLVPAPLHPAEVDVYFEPLAPTGSGSPPEFLELPEGTPLAAPVVSTGPEGFTFQVTRGSYLTSNTLLRVTSDVGGRLLDHTDTNRPNPRESARGGPPTPFFAFGPGAEIGDSLELEFENFFSAPRFTLRFDLFEEDLIQPGSHGGERPDVHASATITWEFWDGVRWTPLGLGRDSTNHLHTSGFVEFESPPRSSGSLAIRARVIGGRYELPPRVSAICLNVLEVRQVERTRNQDVGVGSGRPDQAFTLATNNILTPLPMGRTGEDWPEPLIEVGTPDSNGVVEWVAWTRVEDLAESGHADTHYELDPSAGAIRFGNGLNGAAPKLRQPIRASYTHTRGARGNVPPDLDWIVEVGSRRVIGSNPRSAVLGRDPEVVHEAIERAGRRFHERFRGITARDLEHVAVHTPGLRVARAQALANHDPHAPCVDVPGTTTVVVLPHRRPGDLRAPIPSAAFRRTIADHLEDHRLVTSRLVVASPVFVRFSLAVDVYLTARASSSQVLHRIRRSLSSYFDPFSGGPQGDGWPFGRPVYPSEIYERIDGSSGVDFALDIRVSRSGEAQPTPIDAPLELPRLGLPVIDWAASRIRTLEHGSSGLPRREGSAS